MRFDHPRAQQLRDISRLRRPATLRVGAPLPQIWHAAHYRSDPDRPGKFWMTSHYDFVPDMLILGKGLGGGIYPASVVLTNEGIYDFRMNSTKWGYMSSMAISPIGAQVARKVVEIAQRSSLLENIARLESAMAESFAPCALYPDVYFPGSVLGGIATLGLRDHAVADVIKRKLFERDVLCHSVSAISIHLVKFFPCLTSEPAIAGALEDFALQQRHKGTHHGS